MTKNIGALDRNMRAVLGLVLIYLAFLSGLPAFVEPQLAYGTAIIGVVMLAPSAVRMCRLYSIVGIKTCKAC